MQVIACHPSLENFAQVAQVAFSVNAGLPGW